MVYTDSLISFLLFQHGGVISRWYRWSVSAPYLPSSPYPQAGPLHACSALPARRHAQDHGQRGDILWPPHTIYFHIQVSTQFFYHDILLQAIIKRAIQRTIKSL